MSAIKVKYLMAVTLVIVLLFVVFKFNKVKQPEWKEKRTIRYSYIIENNTSAPQQNVIFKSYSPLTISSTQKLVDLVSTQKFKKQLDKFGNQVMVFDIDFLPPYGKKKITVTATLLLSKIVAGAGSDDELYLSSQPKIEIKNQSIKNLAQKLSVQSSDSYNTQKNIFNWLVDNIDYSGYGMQDKGALYALQNMQGDCTEYAYLNVALNRVLGIPSRAVNGYVVNHDSKLNAAGFHTWSEVWLDGGWQVVDAQKKEFMSNQQNYIAMNIVTNTDTDTHNKKQNFKRFWISNPDLIVTMK
ncbi:MAG: transglutaminase-like domain-containing protein [Proteobacteria bacterium]|nr:transglutaminase-like domain-containing protein [Pseudomonadota bacterium]